MPMGGAGDPAAAARKQQASDDAAVKLGMTKIGSAFSGFTPQFYQGVQDDYMKQALPQLGQQFRQQQRSTTFGLADRGLLNSGSALRQNSLLNTENATQERNLANQGLAQANQVQTNVEQNRSQLVNQLIASKNPDVVASQALSSTAALRSPQSYQPIGDLFSNFANIYAAKQLNTAYQPVGQPIATGISTPSISTGSQRIIQ